MRAKHTPDNPTVATENPKMGDMACSVSTGNEADIRKAMSNDHMVMGYTKITESIHHTFINTCRNDA
jgi:hypothetical protein